MCPDSFWPRWTTFSGRTGWLCGSSSLRFLYPATRYEYELPLPSDIVRALELDARFGKLNPGLVDWTVVAVAERRHIYRVLTTDRRDFAAIRVGPRLTRALELLP